jgi:hypothetical protein
LTLQWISLKQKAQAIFVIEALKARNLTLWEAFTAFDYDNNGVLSPPEFYGALVWLGVPNLTAEDVVDFIEAVDKNRDGLIDYKEYMEMLAGAEESEDTRVTSSEGPNGDSDVVDRTPIAKVEPFGAEELRDIMIRRRQADMARLKEERIRKQAYKDALDVKVFEEELEASKKRKGGANPLVYKSPDFRNANSVDDVSSGVLETIVDGSSTNTADNSIRCPLMITDFKFSTNQLPLRCALTGKSTFYPIHTGTLADRAVKPMRCQKNHVFSQYNYYWACCELCRKQNTAWACWCCSYFVCSVCYDGDRKGKESERRDPSKHPTFLRCFNGCSFTLQIPSAGGADNMSGDFTLTLEMRIEKLPPKSSLQSLLRFTVPDISQARRVHRASVFLNSDGFVVCRALPNDTATGDNSMKILLNKWNIVSIVVQPVQGTVRTYINGWLCNIATELETADLRLHHKLMIFGGGKQAQSRGGDIRRIQICNSALMPTEIMTVFIAMASDNPGLGARLGIVQALYRGFHHRKVMRDREQAEKEAEIIAQEAENLVPDAEIIAQEAENLVPDASDMADQKDFNESVVAVAVATVEA